MHWFWQYQFMAFHLATPLQMHHNSPMAAVTRTPIHPGIQDKFSHLNMLVSSMVMEICMDKLLQLHSHYHTWSDLYVHIS